MKICEEKQADLHNHTTFSDGEYSPGELVEQAASLGLKAVAITDHDTIDGLKAGIEAAEQQNIDFVCGLEATVRFTRDFFRGSLHLLLYFSSDLVLDELFQKATADIMSLGRGPHLTRDRIREINRWFGPGGKTPKLPRNLENEDVYRHGTRISRRHFAQALVEMGITDKREISGIIGNDSPAYIPSGAPLNYLEKYLSDWPILKVFAHPAAGSFPGDSHYKEVLPPLEIVEKLLPEFLRIGLDGLEICYPGHTPELMRRLDEIRRAEKLPLITGGSDCHDKETRPPGVSGVPYSIVLQMREMLVRKEKAFVREGKK